MLELSVADDDYGNVIGRGGRTDRQRLPVELAVGLDHSLASRVSLWPIHAI